MRHFSYSKTILFSVSLLLFLHLHAWAGNGDNKNQSQKNNSGSLAIECMNHLPGQEHSDSVLVIFDKHDLTGAGVIHRQYYADKSGSITVDSIPPGKYYITVIHLGFHGEKKEIIMKIRKNKSHKWKIRLDEKKEYIKGKTRIPADNFNIQKLSILTFK